MTIAENASPKVRQRLENLAKLAKNDTKKPDLSLAFSLIFAYAITIFGSAKATGEPTSSSNVAHSQAS